AAIKADIIEKLTESVVATGLHPDLVDVAPMALYNAVRYNYTDLPPCTLVIDMGARSTDLIFIEQGRVFSRSIPVAGNAITQQIMQEFSLSFDDAEEMKKAHAFVAFGGAYEGPKSETVDKVSKSVRNIITRIHAEINRSINFYRSQQSGQQPSLVLLTGGTSVIPYTDTFLKEKLKMDVDYLNPFLNVAVSEKISADEIGKHAHELGQVVGLALRRELSCPIELNLMPPKAVEEKAFRKKQPVLLFSAIVVVLSLAIWCGYFFKMSRLTQERLDRVKMLVSSLEQVEGNLKVSEHQVAEVTGKIQATLSLSDKRTEWLKIMDQINQCLPEGVWLTSVRPTSLAPAAPVDPNAPSNTEETPKASGMQAVELQGLGYRDKVSSSEVIRSFRDKLRTMPLFSDQTEIRWQPAPAPDDFVIEFKIDAVLKKPLEL
ncbi:MAG: pilus assembly protein PilM, partial [Lentisphaerota bacterium]